MKKHFLLTLSIGLFLWGCSKEKFETNLTDTHLIPKQEVDQFIKDKLAEGNIFKWTVATNEILTAALIHSDSIAFVGFKPANETNINDRIHLFNFQSDAWLNARQKVINRIVQISNEVFPSQNFTEADLILSDKSVPFPSITVKIFNETVVERLRSMAEVRYVEPGSYSLSEVGFRSDAGCGNSPPGYITSADYTTASPNVKIPWNFYNMNIPNAWSTTTGNGVTICLIDTGTSPNQPKVGSQFNSGQSQGRFIDRQGTYVDSWWWWANPDGPDDDCGHGTSMAGLIAAPRGYGGTSVGVAYNADLLAIRGTGDVWVNWWREKEGVRDALYIAGNRGDVKVISMSIGDIFWSSTVADGVYYAYNKGKMMVSAAGTSTWFTSWAGVIFPASMSQTVAVTGVKDGSSLQKCDVCHSGSAVDFIAVMQRASDNSRTSLSLHTSGNTPVRISGSSAATATTAGIAALIWSTNLSQSRAQVLSRMKNAASIYPSRDSNFGWGIIDAGYAVTH